MSLVILDKQHLLEITFFFVQANREEERDKKFTRRVNHSPPQSSSRYSRDSRCVQLPFSTFSFNCL